MIHRRSFLTGLGSLIAAPAIVRVSNIMPVRAMLDAWPEDMWAVPGSDWLVQWGPMTRFSMFYDGTWVREVIEPIAPQFASRGIDLLLGKPQ